MNMPSFALIDGEEHRVSFVQADVSSRNELSAVFQKHAIDLVIHLAARVNVIDSFFNREQCFAVNLDGTVNLMEVMADYGVDRLVFASSSSVYGEQSDRIFHESLPLRPISPYGESKAGAEERIHEYHEKYGLTAGILRLFNVYGPSIRPDLLISRLYASAARAKQITIYNHGLNQKDFTYIGDVLEAIIDTVRFLISGFRGVEVMNIGTSHTHSVNQVIDMTRRMLNRELHLTYSGPMVGDMLYTCADITHARQRIGYAPQTALGMGLKKTFHQLHIDNERGLIAT
jgi:UDP-glucuronate 4-epimerase